MRKITQFVLMTFAFGLLVFGANSSAMAQGRHGQQRREARREYRQDVRRDRREYRKDIHEIRRDHRQGNRLNRYYQVQPRGRAYGYYNNRQRSSNGNRYYYRNGRLYRRW